MSADFTNFNLSAGNVANPIPGGYQVKSWTFGKILMAVIIALGGLSGKDCKAQNTGEYEEVSIFLNVQRVGGTEMTVLISDQTVYLPVTDVFGFLKIKYAVSSTMDNVSGTFITEASKFLIDKANEQIVYLDKIYRLKAGDLIKTAAGLYLKSDYYGEIFGLNCTFSFRNLSVVLSTDLELPVLREMRQEQMRSNLTRLTGDRKADTLIGRKYPKFYFGTADYAAVTSISNKETGREARLSLGLGGIVAGGETNVVLNYHNNEGFAGPQQYYLWRFVDNNLSVAKQILVGKIQAQAIASVYAPIVGIQVTNAPTTYRRSFGSYLLSNHTEPNWMVELYVNGILISYVKADAAGFYSFNVPLVYGNTSIKLRFYGAYGEERSSEQSVSIPFNFLPQNEFEYTASTGVVEDDMRSRFSRFSSNYGLNKQMTIGAGVEYLSSIHALKYIPYMNTSVRVFSNLLASAEYAHGVRSKALLSYNLPSGLQIEINNTWYKKGQTAINNSYLQDRKVIVSFPFRGRRFSAYSRVTLEQILLPNTKYTTAEWLISSVIGNYSTSITTYALFMDLVNPYVYSNLAVGIRGIKSILITQQFQYEYVGHRVVGLKTELEKRMFRNGYLNASFEKNFSSRVTNVELGLRYDFSFAQTRISVRKSRGEIRGLQGISGSLIHDGKSGLTSFNNYTSIGKGAIILTPFLDMNGNNRRDRDEPGATGLKIRMNGGRIKQSLKDTTISITDLEAYASYMIELDPTGFEHLAWKLSKKSYSVVVDPNFVKHIDVPVSVLGEVSGRLTLAGNSNEQGLGGIIINFYNDQSKKIASTATEVDGYFTYLGFLPGVYSAKVDPAQLTKISLVAEPGMIPFTIIRNIEGSVVDDLHFIVK
jgi:hypothetical protein